MRQLSREKHGHYSLNSKKKKSKLIKTTHKLTVPKIFSLINNASETVEFFSEVFEEINKCRFRDKLYFDMLEVQEVTPDAIMYLIAVMNNTRRVRTLQIICEGISPKSNQARETIEKVGFYEFVKPLKKIVESKDPDSTGSNIYTCYIITIRKIIIS